MIVSTVSSQYSILAVSIVCNMTLLCHHSLSSNLSPNQEGPHSTMNEEEFFDALEMAYHEDEVDGVSQFDN